MSRAFVAAMSGSVLIAVLSTLPAIAENGKSCRMEQQCKWVNYKKVCTWVRVCR